MKLCKIQVQPSVFGDRADDPLGVPARQSASPGDSFPLEPDQEFKAGSVSCLAGLKP